MSVINKMLQELDRRHAVPAPGPFGPSGQVRAVPTWRASHEAFWRVVAVLVLLALGWVGWVAYQLQPRTLVTGPATAPAPARAEIKLPQPAPAEAPAHVSVAEVPVAAVEPPSPPRVEPAAPAPAPAPKRARPAPPVSPAAPAAEAAPEPAAKTVLDKRERETTPAERAEGHFRRAVSLLGQGRVAEAQADLTHALRADPAHTAARQAYIALLLEHQQIDAAETLLVEGVARNPMHPSFTLTLARLYAGRSDYRQALEVIDKGVAQAEHHALKGALLQRLERHAEAVTAYEQAVQAAPQPAATWTGLAISLEALARGAEAAQAYRQALEARPLPRELQDYAEARLRALAGRAEPEPAGAATGR